MSEFVEYVRETERQLAERAQRIEALQKCLCEKDELIGRLMALRLQEGVLK